MRFDWLRSLFTSPAPTCPGCGEEFVTWIDYDDFQGYRIERRWSGCPVRRDADLASEHARGTVADREQGNVPHAAMMAAYEASKLAHDQWWEARNKHYAGWQESKRTPLRKATG